MHKPAFVYAKTPVLEWSIACCSAMGALSQSGLMLDERALKSVAPALDQLYSVFNEVRPRLLVCQWTE